jgi:hypothetical protein
MLWSFFQHPRIDSSFNFHLSEAEVAFPPDVGIKIPFPPIDPSLLESILDRGGVQRAGDILVDVFERLEYLVCW